MCVGSGVGEAVGDAVMVSVGVHVEGGVGVYVCVGVFVHTAAAAVRADAVIVACFVRLGPHDVSKNTKTNKIKIPCRFMD